MVLGIGFSRTPVMPTRLQKLYQGIISAEGKWVMPKGSAALKIESMPEGWELDFKAPNKYTIAHKFGDRNVSIQTYMRDPSTSLKITELSDNAVTLETFGADGEPAPQEFKFALRQLHLVLKAV